MMKNNNKVRFYGFSFFTALTCVALLSACGKKDDDAPAAGAQACIDQNGQTTNIDAYRSQMYQNQYNYNYNYQNQQYYNYNQNQYQYGYGYNPSGLPSCQNILSQQYNPQYPNGVNNQGVPQGYYPSYAYQTQAIGLSNVNSYYPTVLNSSSPASSQTFVANLKAGDIIQVSGTRVWYAQSSRNISLSNPLGNEKLLSTNDSSGLVLYVNNKFIKATHGTTVQITEDCELHAGLQNNSVLYSRTVNGTSGSVGVYIQRKNF